ncbi:hypothetical protein QUA42_11280 [Microcoleus sp. Pol11C2]|uniref:hypothetical protein n=1 Tax=Microcoleus sp. Pol11C2 TaxID=3055389 RepID=UPI002FD3FEB0
MAVATLDARKNVYLLVVNDRATSYTVNADISELIKTGNGTVREFSYKTMDEVVGSLRLKGGNASFALAGNSAILIKFARQNRSSNPLGQNWDKIELVMLRIIYFLLVWPWNPRTLEPSNP